MFIDDFWVPIVLCKRDRTLSTQLTIFAHGVWFTDAAHMCRPERVTMYFYSQRGFGLDSQIALTMAALDSPQQTRQPSEIWNGADELPDYSLGPHEANDEARAYWEMGGSAGDLLLVTGKIADDGPRPDQYLRLNGLLGALAEAGHDYSLIHVLACRFEEPSTHPIDAIVAAGRVRH